MLSEAFFTALRMRYPAVGPTVKLTFSADAAADVLRFVTRMKTGDIAVRQVGAPIAEMQAAIAQSGYVDWANRSSRVFLVSFPGGVAFSQRDFTTLRGIESVRLLSENPLNVLLTGRQKKQHDEARRIIEDCLTASVVKAVREWGLTIEAELDTSINELPGIRFTYRLDGAIIHSVLLDAWSGRILIDGKASIVPVVFLDAQQVRDILMQEINTCIENA